MTFLPGGVRNDVDELRGIVERIKAQARSAGRDPEHLSYHAQVLTCIAESDERAWELARHPNVGWIAITAASIDSSVTWDKWGFENPLGKFSWSTDLNVTSVPARDVALMSREIPDQVTDFSIVWGSPERVAARIQTYLDAGINEVQFVNMAALADPEHGARWEHLAAEVLQHLGASPRGLSRAGNP
jgi:alkanesulfonate monooxygenase SsuD/methylene tetrahydromethanopterin reductase-like flavin-dependent oxidoreductase (luciferase family)